MFSAEAFDTLPRFGFRPMTTQVTALQFEEVGGALMTAGNDGRVRLWDLKTAASVREICETLSGGLHSSVATNVSFLADVRIEP